jgi:hypothetical protein
MKYNNSNGKTSEDGSENKKKVVIKKVKNQIKAAAKHEMIFEWRTIRLHKFKRLMVLSEIFSFLFSILKKLTAIDCCRRSLKRYQ